MSKEFWGREGGERERINRNECARTLIKCMHAHIAPFHQQGALPSGRQGKRGRERKEEILV